jgi:TrpR-related protein YerC/YecD
MRKITTDGEILSLFYEAVLRLESPAECEQFFCDVCTPQEMAAISQRLAVAKMLSDKHSYIDIAENLGASTATISRVSRSMANGGQGYSAVFRRMERDGVFAESD